MGTLQPPNPNPSVYHGRSSTSISSPNPNSLSGPNPNSPSFDQVSNFFSLPLSDAADALGVCPSVLKKVCYNNGLVRWPYRKYLSGKSIEEIKKDATLEKSRQLTELPKVAGERNGALANPPILSSLGSQGQHRTASGSLQEMPKSRVLTNQPGTSIVLENSRDMHNLNMMKRNSGTRDEFKYGFPSSGLSTVSYRWWEKENTYDPVADNKKIDLEEALECKQQSESSVDNAVTSINKENGTGMEIQPTSSLSGLRRRAVKEAAAALKLGIYREYGLNKLHPTKKQVLLQIFKSSLPSEWNEIFATQDILDVQK